MGGRLIDKAKLERNRQARAERKARILDAARHSFRHYPLASVSLETIGQRARVRDGLASMFYGSLEELFLTVLKSELDDWYQALHQKLEAVSEELGSGELARLLSNSLKDRETLTRMLAVLPVILEQVVESPAALIYLRAEWEWIDRVGQEIEARHPRFQRGDGGRLLGRLRVAIAGLEPAIRPLGVIGPGLGGRQDGRVLDFHAELEDMMRVILGGWRGR